MATHALPGASAPVDVQTGPRGLAKWATFHNLILAICIAILGLRLWTIFQGGGWADRAQFFGEGDLRPNLIDFVFSEILVNYLVVRVIAFRYSTVVYGLLVLSAFAYFTRVPLILLTVAIFFSAGITKRAKVVLGAAALSMSVLLLYIRFGEAIVYGEATATFFLTYPLIGIARLLETPQIYDPTALQYLGLFFKPLDAVLFVVDYIQQYDGELSPGRFVGIDLTRFVYIQSLQSAYNAFGTVLYPFILIAGWTIGPILFVLFIMFQYLMYKFATQSEVISRRFLYVLLTTGVLFSWASPFVWLAPLLFTKFTNRSQK
ncbi:hypothetical protein [Altericroceibacterium xinjiangense]|uniref:hypothetical protein n=1 Tax=Altericroceibacterium xinjiangense TaxID=762261 RepID=UPI0019D159E1|nr:hypothetical protein [Altericroceibacterium xinjiangense]